MSSDSAGAKPPTMQRGGRYSENQPASGKRFVRPLEPYIRQAVRSVSQAIDQCDGSFSMADFGAADGEMTFFMSDIVLDELTAPAVPGIQRQLSVICEDQADNDFSALFNRAEQLYNQRKDVFILCSGRSFYQQCLPSKSIHLGTCCLSAHWLNSDYSPDGYQPTDCELLCREAEKRLDTEDKIRLAIKERKAAVDWETFLIHRAEELVEGGYFVLPHTLRSSVIGSPEALDREMTDKLTALIPKAVLALHEQGHLREGEVKRMTFPWMTRSEEELLAPFTDPSSPVRRAGLTLDRSSKFTIHCPIQEEYSAGRINKTELFQRLTLSLRSWSEGLISGALGKDRSPDEAVSLVDKVYAKVQATLESGGYDNAALSYPMMILVMKKSVMNSS